MEKGRYIVAIDQGTTSCRAILVNHKGEIAGMEQREFTQHFPQPAWVEHDAEEIWQVQRGVFKRLLDRHGIVASDVLAIGITNQRETTVIWDRKTGKPIHRAIVWQDRRTADLCEWIKTQPDAAYITDQTGLVIDAYFSGTKVRWILDHVDGARTKAENGDLCFGTIDSWLVYKMTEGRVHATDPTNASRTLLYSIREHAWDQRILDFLDIPKSLLPQVRSSADDYGTFNYNGVHIPICGLAGDQQSALFGQACFDAGMAKNTYGTGCFLLMNIGSEYVRSTNGLLTTLCCNAQGQACYGLEGSIFIAGAAIQWLRDGLQIIETSSETNELAQAIRDEHDVVVVPAFAGLGAPYWNMYARGAIFGLTRGSGRPQLTKATLDALAYQTVDVIEAMRADAGQDLNVLKVDGGACANDYLMQFQADMLQADVERPSVIETTALGAAYLAGIQCDIWDAETIRKNRTVDRLFTPTMDAQKRSRLYAQWQKAVQRTMNWIDADA